MLLGCLGHTGPASAEFRTIDGTGNHLLDTSLGAAGDDIIRLGYPSAYPDGVGDIITDADTVNAREVSNALSAQTGDVFNARGLSDWAVQWGQFITHDLDFTPTDAVYDTQLDGSVADYSIDINDPSDPLGPNAISFHRSQFQPGTGDGTVTNTPQGLQPVARVLTNAVTSFLDGSMIYGSDDTRADALRTFSGGQLITSADGLLPGYNTDGLDNDDPFGGGDSLFLAGDVRANEQVGLTATHALFVREHNRLAAALAEADPTLSDESDLPNSAQDRGAEIQAITYNEYLPAILGDAAPDPDAFAYSPTVDPRITSSFAVAAFRFGHSMQSGDLDLVDDQGQTVGSLALADAFFDPAFLGDAPENTDLVLKGLATQTAQENDLLMHDALRNFLFGPPGAGGLDLMALDLERGRDHGLPGMNALRVAYGLDPIRQWTEITNDAALITQLRAVYGNNPTTPTPSPSCLPSSTSTARASVNSPPRLSPPSSSVSATATALLHRRRRPARLPHRRPDRSRRHHARRHHPAQHRHHRVAGQRVPRHRDRRPARRLRRQRRRRTRRPQPRAEQLGTELRRHEPTRNLDRRRPRRHRGSERTQRRP